MWLSACCYRSAVHPLETGGGECPDLMDYYMRPRCTGTRVLMWLFNPWVGRDLAVSSPPADTGAVSTPLLHTAPAEVTRIAPLTWLDYAGRHSALPCHLDLENIFGKCIKIGCFLVLSCKLEDILDPALSLFKEKKVKSLFFFFCFKRFHLTKWNIVWRKNAIFCLARKIIKLRPFFNSKIMLVEENLYIFFKDFLLTLMVHSNQACECTLNTRCCVATRF